MFPLENDGSALFKICLSCKEKKIISAFHRNKRYRDGFTSVCKVCKNRRRARRNSLEYRNDIKVTKYKQDNSFKSESIDINYVYC
jgi:hypothetical protein